MGEKYVVAVTVGDVDTAGSIHIVAGFTQSANVAVDNFGGLLG